MSRLFRLSGAVRDDPAVEAWFAGAARLDPAVDAWLGEPADELRRIARAWFEVMRGCGPDVLELIHDRSPVACVGEAAFGYVNAFKAHVNVGFFQGAALPDPAGLLEGGGRWMRHVTLRPAEPVDAAALTHLIAAAYHDARQSLASEGA
ncbi:MAG TPA: DUF1801 domain-containing protein [Caulobacteraceae bacterium]|jgi:hypothetical protein|nr:DUF1801 domain-containing protein [Caulobacteraceae bacterium]